MSWGLARRVVYSKIVVSTCIPEDGEKWSGMLAHSSGSVVSTREISWGVVGGLVHCETNGAEEDVILRQETSLRDWVKDKNRQHRGNESWDGRMTLTAHHITHKGFVRRKLLPMHGEMGVSPTVIPSSSAEEEVEPLSSDCGVVVPILVEPVVARRESPSRRHFGVDILWASASGVLKGFDMAVQSCGYPDQIAVRTAAVIQNHVWPNLSMCTGHPRVYLERTRTRAPQYPTPAGVRVYTVPPTPLCGIKHRGIGPAGPQILEKYQLGTINEPFIWSRFANALQRRDSL
ncbi:hypothetical protein B0H14DRAFT_3125476 [Mycena olivaceomarginata]|nr:hypothetical protein B0H14DRAFT_3125476 [Mycena olivaceomarginata]